MEQSKSPDPYVRILHAMLCDVQTLHSEVFTPRACKLTCRKIDKRVAREGIGFLTKTLPRLGKALDRALSGDITLDANRIGFKSIRNSKLPKLFGELFQRVFSHDGRVLPAPCVTSVKSLRMLLFVFYKLELPYDADQEQKVLEKFERTDQELGTWNEVFGKIADTLDSDPTAINRIYPVENRKIIKAAREFLSDLFSTFDVMDIHPRHGPGAVSTKERLSGKYSWTRISKRIRQTYPIDAYYFASKGHVCDRQMELNSISDGENPARVLLVPKDSRGPRLISCEPLEFQWIQQGLGRAITKHVEQHPLTKDFVRFSDQRVNQWGAELGSLDGRYATLDLNEASDRVSIGLVRLLFPEPLRSALLNCRSLSTKLPDKRIIKLNKFAPMGSALCFPILALSVFSILYAATSDAGSLGHRKLWRRKSYIERCKHAEGIAVYGDDVIVPTAQAANAIKWLESFGFVVNRDKSYTTGFFKESCGTDAFKGVVVTPVRIRTVWSSSRCPNSYVSYIAYANAMHKRGFYVTYDYIVSRLVTVYGNIPDKSIVFNDEVPCLIETPEAFRNFPRRVNADLQKIEHLLPTVVTPKVEQVLVGWKMLLRYFAEQTSVSPLALRNEYLADAVNRIGTSLDVPPFSVRLYTERRTSYLAKRWR